MADLRMKLNNNNEIKVKMRANDSISMKFDDYQKFKEEDPIFKDSPAYSITYNDINYWNNKSDFSGNYNDLTHKPNLNQYATIDYVTSGLSNKVDKESGMGLSQNSFTTEEKNKLASLENYDDTAIVEALSEKADISDIPTLTSELDNDSGFITKDVDDLTYYPTNDSVNSIVSQKQNIIDSENLLSADLVDDTSTTNKFVTATDITNWNNKSDFSGSYNDLTNKPTIPTFDSTVSTSSTNGVENQAITNYVNNGIVPNIIDLSTITTSHTFINNSNFSSSIVKLGKLVVINVYMTLSAWNGTNEVDIMYLPSSLRPITSATFVCQAYLYGGWNLSTNAILGRVNTDGYVKVRPVSTVSNDAKTISVSVCYITN